MNSHISLNTFFVAAIFAALSLPFGLRADGIHTDRLDPHHLPLGDGRVSTTPQRGYLLSCQMRFRGGGAQADGPWIHGTTWDMTQKFAVQGRVVWPQANFQILTGEIERKIVRVVKGNGLPVNTPTGNFPISPADPAFRIDRNPNRIAEQPLLVGLPKDPLLATAPSCVPMGMVGVALNGVAIYNALDDGGRDAVAHEMQDLCNGHPQMSGQYHYHGPSPCLPGANANEALLGYMADGFGLFSSYDSQGRELIDSDLDECHGRTSEIAWDGRRVPMYHYVLTREFPYTIGCFRGAPVMMQRRGPPPGGPPPQ